ncbi:MAG: hypothetical protein NZ988_01060 [Thaumarchaeota archaeon]|nr:hypothetical protein [Candidatus Calditenuaceae archaeon]MDW8186622.1 hypothetical protein [Nitrososphaerota archaeon]
MLRSQRGAEVLLLVVALLTLPIPSSSQEERACELLIGYGGPGFLPLVDGGVISFSVGEQLYALSPLNDSRVRLVDPSGREERYFLEDRTRTLLREFARGDGGVWRFVSDDGCEMTLAVSERGSLFYGTITVWRDVRDQLTLSFEGPPYIGFRVEEPTDNRSAIWARPGDEVYFDIGVPFRSVLLYLSYPDPVTIYGEVGYTPFSYTIDPIVGVYRYQRPVNGTVVSLKIPNLGSTGPEGIFPLRYGSYTVRVVGLSPEGQTFFKTFDVEVAPFAFRSPKFSTYKQLSLNEFREGVSLVFLNYETGAMESIHLQVALYDVMVIDQTSGDVIEDYSLNVAGFVDVRDGPVTVLVPQRFNLREMQLEDNALTIKPSLRVGGVDISDVIGEVVVTRNSVTVLKVPMSEVLLRVRLAGYPEPLRAKLSLNGTFSAELNGSARLRIPAFVYNATAETSWGTARRLFDASKEKEVELVVYTPSDFMLALALVAAAQLIAFTVISLRAYRAKGHHRVKSDR